jgi:predicted amidohydrolase YtcJ
MYAATCAATYAATTADLVVMDARVLTVDSNRPVAEAFAVREGRFVAVGDASEMEGLIGPHTQVWRLPGKVITPGFNDAHLHPSPAYPEDSPHHIVDCSPANVRSIDDLVSALQRQAVRTPKEQLIRGRGYDDIKLGRHPTCHDLDRASTEHPIVIRHSSGHVSVCNTFTLRAAKIGRDSSSPAGGVIGKDQDGDPNGYLAETAAGLVSGVGSRPSPASRDAKLRGMLVCLQRFAAKGITSAGVAGSDPGELQLYETLRDQGDLPVRLNVMLSSRYLDTVVERRHAESSADNMIQLGTIKIFHGNSLSGRTCWVSEPYVDNPTYFGVPPARSQEDLDALVWKIHSAGLQMACHSNGDREIDMVLTAIERAQARTPRPDARHRIEHCSVVRQDLLDRIKKDQVVIVPHSYEWEHGDKLTVYGEQRWEWMFPNKRAVDLGIAVAGHSDWPISAADPLLRIQCLVTRRSAEGLVIASSQRMAASPALRIWTVGGAYTTFEEGVKGAIVEGLLADFVVLSADPTATPEDQIKDIRVERTVLGGKVVFSGEASQPVQ